jgi:hypothetical protein
MARHARRRIGKAVGGDRPPRPSKYLAEPGAQTASASGQLCRMGDRANLSQVHLEEDYNVSVADAERKYHLWDLDEADRIVRLAMTYRCPPKSRCRS